jgi:hypothetical protein
MAKLGYLRDAPFATEFKSLSEKLFMYTVVSQTHFQISNFHSVLAVACFTFGVF